MNDLHKHHDGVPKIKPPPDIGERCDTCLTCKGIKANMGNRDTHEDATVLGQGIWMDFWFMVQSSQTPGRLERLSAHDGETAYLLITCHNIDMMWGVSTKGKKPPLSWLNRWFSQYFPNDVQHRYAAMDKGGELANNPEVMALLDEFDYAPRLTAHDASHQNASAERPHQTIGNALRIILTGANVLLWPYAFYYMMFLHNLLPHGVKGVPHTRAGFGRPNLNRIHTFGCCVYGRPPSKRNHKLNNNVFRAMFLNFTGNMSQVHYCDLDTKRFKTATHVKFDEGMSDLENPTPHSRQLRDALGGAGGPPPGGGGGGDTSHGLWLVC
jgi:hypothetical protein